MEYCSVSWLLGASGLGVEVLASGRWSIFESSFTDVWEMGWSCCESKFVVCSITGQRIPRGGEGGCWLRGFATRCSVGEDGREPVEEESHESVLGGESITAFLESTQ